MVPLITCFYCPAAAHFQIAACQHQTLYGILVNIQLPVYNLLVNFRIDTFLAQQLFKGLLYFLISFLQKFADQLVAAGIYPVRRCRLCIKIIKNRPRIIDIFYIPKTKSVVPFFDFIFLITKPVFFQRAKNLFFCKAKAFSIFI